MATLVSFHAHPDDESICVGGTLAMAAAAGHRVVLVVATRGELGEGSATDDLEQIGVRRVGETLRAAAILGVSRVEFLGYRDSGLMGHPANAAAACFWQADVNEAASRLAAILRQEAADVLTVYDSNGGYGHPDHIQVHRVGHRAADLAGVARVYEFSVNRDHLRRSAVQAGGKSPDAAELERVGLPESMLTTAIDVQPFLDLKRRAIAAHSSQMRPDSWFMQLPAAVFDAAFGREWFRRTRPVFARSHELSPAADLGL